jgi:hypothetical protein
VLPDGHEGSDTILAVVEQNNPTHDQLCLCMNENSKVLTFHRGSWTRQ